jgi:hypothetical protein
MGQLGRMRQVGQCREIEMAQSRIAGAVNATYARFEAATREDDAIVAGWPAAPLPADGGTGTPAGSRGSSLAF